MIDAEYRVRDGQGFVITGSFPTLDSAESRVAYIKRHNLREGPFKIEAREVSKWTTVR